MKAKTLLFSLLFGLSAGYVQAQIEIGSDGRDGALNPTVHTRIDMADHPDGIYRYSSVNIPKDVEVSFVPNAKNTPVVWLVQGNVVINGVVNLNGQVPVGKAGGIGGPGGFRGGTGGPSPTAGQGPGGGLTDGGVGGNASYGLLGLDVYDNVRTIPPGPMYGNPFLIPLLGGSGGGGSINVGGAGGGGAIIIATGGSVQIDGLIWSSSTRTWQVVGVGSGGAGSGGAIRIVASKISGAGHISTMHVDAAVGRIRFDTFENNFGGGITGSFSQGSQFLILPTKGQLPELNVISVAGVPVSMSPTGVLSTPDAILSAQQPNPIAIVVQCANVPLNTPITVSVKPVNGVPVSAVGRNNAGTLASSTATVSLNIPRGGGIIYATAATGN